MVYAGGRPLWHISLSLRTPIHVSAWNRAAWRRVEAVRDNIMRGLGSGEPFIAENVAALEAAIGQPLKAMHWRKPLSVLEIPQMAATPDVRARKGRP